MTRASLLAATAAAAFLLVIPLARATGSSDLRLTRVRGSEFPERTFVLSLPDSRALTSRNIQVTENGGPVSYLRVKPASKAAERTFGVVLVLDSSWSMNGKPIAAAVAAAQAFADERNPNEAIGVIAFNEKATTLLPFTTTASAISDALKTTPHLSTGTNIFDAVKRAEFMIRDGHINAGSIIVLSDGADTGSTTTLDEVASRAMKVHARIYTVGLQDKDFSPQTLKDLAEAGDGQYSQAKPEALAALFAGISRILSNEYLVGYTSLLGPGIPVRVEVAVPTLGTAKAAYTTPQPEAATTGTSKPSIGTRIVASPVTMVMLALTIGAILALLVIGLLQPRRSGLPGRIAEFVSIPELQRDHGATAAVAIGSEPVVRKDWWPRLQETLEIARINVAPELLIGGTAVATVLVFLLIYAASGSVWWGLFALAVPYFTRAWVLGSLKRQRNRFAEQFPDALQVVASALRSGHSFTGSLAVVVDSSADPMRSEMHRVVADEQLGMPIQRSLAVVADRMASTDVDQLALVAELQRQAGGDMAEVVDRVAETVRERFDLKRLVDTLTTQGRLSRWIVSLLPLVIVAVLWLENRHYFDPLTGSTAGRVVVGLAAAWAVLGSVVIKRIVEIEV